jgi:hypothetical protein
LGHGPIWQLNTRTQPMVRRHPKNGRACADVLQRLAQQPLARRLRHLLNLGPLRPANLGSSHFTPQPANATAPPPCQHQRTQIRRHNNSRPAHDLGSYALSHRFWMHSPSTPSLTRSSPTSQLLTGLPPPSQASGYKTLLAHRAPSLEDLPCF